MNLSQRTYKKYRVELGHEKELISGRKRVRRRAIRPAFFIQLRQFKENHYRVTSVLT